MKVKMLLIAFAMMIGNVVSAEPSTLTYFGQKFPAFLVVADAIATSNAQGVLPCHSKPNVKQTAPGGGYSYYVTDCEANGFK